MEYAVISKKGGVIEYTEKCRDCKSFEKASMFSSCSACKAYDYINYVKKDSK